MGHAGGRGGRHPPLRALCPALARTQCSPNPRRARTEGPLAPAQAPVTCVQPGGLGPSLCLPVPQFPICTRGSPCSLRFRIRSYLCKGGVRPSGDQGGTGGGSVTCLLFRCPSPFLPPAPCFFLRPHHPHKIPTRFRLPLPGRETHRKTACAQVGAVSLRGMGGQCWARDGLPGTGRGQPVCKARKNIMQKWGEPSLGPGGAGLDSPWTSTLSFSYVSGLVSPSLKGCHTPQG